MTGFPNRRPPDWAERLAAEMDDVVSGPPALRLELWWMRVRLWCTLPGARIRGNARHTALIASGSMISSMTMTVILGFRWWTFPVLWLISIAIVLIIAPGSS